MTPCRVSHEDAESANASGRPAFVRGLFRRRQAPTSRYGSAAGVGLALAALLLGLGALAVRWHMMAASVDYVPVTSDEAITVLQAKRIQSGEFPLLVMAQPYQFPLEAYFSAPLVSLIPRTTFGARYVSFAEGVAGVILLLLLARRLGPWRQHWPVAVLILFPSAYLLTIQFGYSLPHNSPVYLCGWGAMLLTLGVPASFSWIRLARFVVAGLLCGLAFTNNMLALSLVVPVLVAAVFQGGWRWVLPNALLLACGVCVGLIPYLAAVRLLPGAHDMVAGTRPLDEALAFLWEPAITVTLTRALGITPTIFPDTKYCVEFAAWLFPVMPFIFSLVGVAATAISVVRIVGGVIRRRVVELTLYDIGVGVTWLSLAAFVLSDRSVSNAYRYLVPAAWSFPFLVGAVFAASPRGLKVILGIACACYAAVNAMTVFKLTDEWRQPGFAEFGVDAPDMRPALEFLEAHDITHCVASHWQAYRLNYYTDESIACAQPLNERFSGWPIAYKNGVDAQTNVAYVLSDRSNPYFTPATFEAHLQTMGVKAVKTVRGAFSIYHDFAPDPARGVETLIPPDRITVTTSHNAGAARFLVEKRTQPWSSHQRQEPGMWVQLNLAQPAWLSRVVLLYDDYFGDRAVALNLYVVTDVGLKRVGENVVTDTDPFEWINGHPVYERYLQTIRSPPIYARGLRLEIAEANPRRDWSFAQVELYETQTASTASIAVLSGR